MFLGCPCKINSYIVVLIIINFETDNDDLINAIEEKIEKFIFTKNDIKKEIVKKIWK